MDPVIPSDYPEFRERPAYRYGLERLRRRHVINALYAANPAPVAMAAPPSFALKLGHKDMRLATELGRELGVPMRLANMAFAEMTEALNRGWENRDSRSFALLQLERCGLKVEVDPRRIQEVFDRDPPHEGGSKRDANM